MPRQPVTPRTHIVQGAVLLVTGLILLLTPAFEWGLLISVPSFGYLVYGLIQLARRRPKE
jgi:hypothetical protein